MNKLSVKLGLLFFIFLVIIELILFYFLYSGLVNNRVEEELAELQARGNSHRNILQKHFDKPTINHVALMETEAVTDVVIMSHEGAILAASNELTPEMQDLLQTEKSSIPTEGKIVEGRWKTELTISSVSPVMIDNKLVGHVFMFKDTIYIQKMILQLKKHFILVGALAFVVTIITIFFLTRAITLPLIKMKQATKSLSKGDFSVSLTEITSNDELGELSRSIQKLAEDLHHLKEERNEFLASISHELRTPLTYVKGYADLAKKEGLSEKERNKYLAIIVEEASHISRLVKDLFELAKIDQHSFVIHQEMVNVNQFLTNLVMKMRPAFSEKGIGLQYDPVKDLQISVDPNRFEQVLINLLDNALKYSNSKDVVEIRVSSNEENIFITVIDSGEGIPPKDLPYIFDRLYRVDKSRARKSGGAGLGLAIVKEIVEAHGGVVTAKSELGKGTTITIQLRRT
ncbi:sensor histidine kinase [Bacillus sp. PS06]|uniref:HAMP domain-containing sensor histidine kinase n=1 Tax=Bacillus sp. PS06 TaxID=2764176 RepID=UPI00177E3E12|nr:HAMP domain-containing sensor histidine kinase [Bacillus sp. PS06]MBD8067785.1 HAMP domain-containing histidine kinase [Bacillus sp. PS06]